MYPLGHARNGDSRLDALLDHKFDTLAAGGVENASNLRNHLDDLECLSAAEVDSLYSFAIRGLD